MARNGVMLATKLDLFGNTYNRLPEWVYVQPKLDGKRCRARITNQKVTRLCSSENNDLMACVPHIFQILQSAKIPADLDGELYCHGMPLQSINGICSRQKNLSPSYEKIQYHIFDVVNKSDQSTRLNLLSVISKLRSYWGDPASPIQIVPSKLIPKSQIGYYKAKYVDEGYEGIIVRNPAGFYEEKRSKYLWKIKAVELMSARIVNWQQEISIAKDPKPSLGAFICRFKNGVEFNVGTGSLMTKPNRELYFQPKYKKLWESGRATLYFLSQGLTGDGKPRSASARKLGGAF